MFFGTPSKSHNHYLSTSATLTRLPPDVCVITDVLSFAIIVFTVHVEAKEGWTFVHTEYLGFHSTRRDPILHAHFLVL